MNLKKDGAYYIGEFFTGEFSCPLVDERIFFDFSSCASNSAYDFINVYNENGKFMGYLELIGGDYE